MTTTTLYHVGGSAHAFWPDGTSTALRWGVPIPSDWEDGTDILLRTLVMQSDNPGNRTAVFRSLVSCQPADESRNWNIESTDPFTQVLASGIHTLIERTISGDDVEHGEVIDWALVRDGGNVADTVNGWVVGKMSTWIEYTALR